MTTRHELTLSETARGERLDVVLARELNLSRSQVALRVEAGEVWLRGRPARKAGERLRGGEQVVVTLPPPPPSVAEPEDLPLSIVYEDAHLIIVDKAASMVVHPSPGHDRGTLVNALVHRYGALAEPTSTADGRPRPGIVHRLDRGTSGLMVVARDVVTRDGLTRAIARRTMKRSYVAVVLGTRLEDAVRIETLYARHPTERRRFSSKVEAGKVAVTHVRVLARSRHALLVLCQLETGRTHQIRVHLADRGYAVAGDPLYGHPPFFSGPEAVAVQRLERQALHSARLEVTHPVLGTALDVTAPLPTDLARLVGTLFGSDWVARFAAGEVRFDAPT